MNKDFNKCCVFRILLFLFAPPYPFPHGLVLEQIGFLRLQGLFIGALLICYEVIAVVVQEGFTAVLRKIPHRYWVSQKSLKIWKHITSPTILQIN